MLLQDIMVKRNNLSIKTLHDNLDSLIKNKGTINFKLKKENLISTTKLVNTIKNHKNVILWYLVQIEEFLIEEVN